MVIWIIREVYANVIGFQWIKRFTMVNLWASPFIIWHLQMDAFDCKLCSAMKERQWIPYHRGGYIGMATENREHHRIMKQYDQLMEVLCDIRAVVHRLEDDYRTRDTLWAFQMHTIVD